MILSGENSINYEWTWVVHDDTLAKLNWFPFVNGTIFVYSLHRITLGSFSAVFLIVQRFNFKDVSLASFAQFSYNLKLRYAIKLWSLTNKTVLRLKIDKWRTHTLFCILLRIYAKTDLSPGFRCLIGFRVTWTNKSHLISNISKQIWLTIKILYIEIIK